MKIDTKLSDVGTTIFTIMSKLAAEHNAINIRSGNIKSGKNYEFKKYSSRQR